MRKEIDIDRRTKAIIQAVAVILLKKAGTGLSDEELLGLVLKGGFRITVKQDSPVVLETEAFDETGTPEHPYTVGELESAISSTAYFEAGEGKQGLENLGYMGISEDMARFFGWPDE